MAADRTMCGTMVILARGCWPTWMLTSRHRPVLKSTVRPLQHMLRLATKTTSVICRHPPLVSIYAAQVQVYWGATQIADIKPTDVANMLPHCESEGLSASCLRKLRSMVYQIFTAAEADDLITQNSSHYIEFEFDDDELI